MKSDILFFGPPQTKEGACLQNRALLWLASYLKKKGFHAKVIYLDGNFKTSIRRALAYYKPKYVAVSCKWYTNLYGAVLVAREIKKIDKAVKVIAGGHTAAYFDKELLRNSDFDIVIRGDAELPLLNILNNRSPVNCTLKERGIIKRYKPQYVWRQKTIEDYTLVEPKVILEDPVKILGGENFIWTGKGCTQECFYCGAASGAQEELFHRKGLIYRPIRDVLRDIDILSKYSKSLMFDFACPPQSDVYYLRLFKNMPQGKFKMFFAHWYLPSRKLIDQISKTFRSATMHLDTSTLSEELRGSLSDRKLLKPFFSNEEIEDIVRYCDEKRNIKVVLENIAGLPGERIKHVMEHTNFSRYLVRKYCSVELISYLPLSIEPSAILQKHHRRFNMHCCRNTFMDFMHLTKNAFDSNITYPFSGFFKKSNHKDIFSHPYGVYETKLNKKSSYVRTTIFSQIMNKEFLANRIVYNLNFR